MHARLLQQVLAGNESQWLLQDKECGAQGLGPLFPPLQSPHHPVMCCRFHFFYLGLDWDSAIMALRNVRLEWQVDLVTEFLANRTEFWSKPADIRFLEIAKAQRTIGFELNFREFHGIVSIFSKFGGISPF
jgi:hypothetical protein